MTNVALQARIERLEQALSDANLPYSDYTCECCGTTYVPGYYDSCRCSACCMTCHCPKGSKVWIQGPLCPSKRKDKN
jgi:hypothetical protein